MPGYSGTPLAKKLGIRPGARVVAVGEVPDDYKSWLEPLPEGASIVQKTRPPFQSVHVFATRRSTLARQLVHLRKALVPDGYVWISWPKKTSKVPTDITEDVIREVALPMGFVDIKVCAVSEVWSGLKLVIRVSERPGR